MQTEATDMYMYNVMYLRVHMRYGSKLNDIMVHALEREGSLYVRHWIHTLPAFLYFVYIHVGRGRQILYR